VVRPTDGEMFDDPAGPEPAPEQPDGALRCRDCDALVKPDDREPTQEMLTGRRCQMCNAWHHWDRAVFLLTRAELAELPL
jgi:hypothetical protein